MKDVTPQAATESLISKYGKLIVAVVVVIVGVGVAYNVWSYTSEKKEMSAQAALFKAEHSYKETFLAAQRKSETPPDAKKDPKKKEVKPESVKPADVDFTEAANLYKKVITEHPKTNAAMLAAHGLSSIYVDKKQFKEALDTLKQVETDKKSLVAVLTKLKISNIYEKLGQCQDALPVLNTIAADKNNAYIKPEVLLKTGVCYEKLGQFDKARDAYTTITKEFANSTASQEAEKYLKLLSLNKG